MAEYQIKDEFTVDKGSGGDFERVPEGLFLGRCYLLATIGTQNVTFKGETKQQKKVILGWELLDDEAKMKDGKPHTITKTYTHTLNEKGNLYADLNSWRGKKFTPEELEGFSLKNVLGAYCQVQVLHTDSENGRTYANVNNLLPAPKGDKPKAVNEDILFGLYKPDKDIFNKLPDFLKRRVEAGLEWDKDARTKEGFEPAKEVTAQSTIYPNRTTDDVVITDIPEDTDSIISTSEIPF
jgi:hypothetical protein